MNEQTTWIPCDDRLPECNDVYLVAWLPKSGYHGKSCFYEILEFSDGEWVEDIPQSKDYGGFDVLAWRELPEPYIIRD